MLVIRLAGNASRSADIPQKVGNVSNLIFENVHVFQAEDGTWHLSYEYGTSRRILSIDEIHAAEQSFAPDEATVSPNSNLARNLWQGMWHELG
jgi:hypothetical protein